MQHIIIVFISLLFITLSSAQTTLTYQHADSITYHQFVNKDFKALHRSAKQALRNDIDFYYLRLRMGISYYEKGNYETALRHLKIAHTMSPADSVAQEYLYFSLLYTNRTEDAYDLADTFPESMQRRINYNVNKANKFVGSFQSVSVSAGVGYNTNITANEDNTYPDTSITMGTLQGETSMGSILLANRFSRRLNIYNGFSFFNLHSKGIIYTPIIDTSKTYTNNCFQYNFGANYRFKSQILIGGSFGFYKERSNLFSALLDTSDFNIRYFDNPYEGNAYSGSLYAFYRIRQYDLGLSATLNNLSDTLRYQGEATFAYYPLGNQNIYLVFKAAYLLDSNNHKFICSQRIGGRITKWLWTEAHGSYGNHQNYLPLYGFVAFNTVEPILFTAGANLTFSFGNFNIIPVYTLQKKAESILQQGINEEIININNKYYNHLITLTLKWNL